MKKLKIKNLKFVGRGKVKKRHIVAIDLGATNTRIALVGKKATRILYKREFSTLAYRTKRELIDAIINNIKILLRVCRLDPGQLLGLGIGTPGLVDYRKGIVHYLVNIPGWRNVPLGRMVRSKIGVPAVVDNDVNVMALGELKHGAGKGAKNLICITLGSGVGGGIIIDGKLYRGSTLSAGEIGHTPINEEGPKCNCGGIGCMETYVGNRYIVQNLLRELRRGRQSVIPELVNGQLSSITPQVITQAAKKGDRLALEVWQDVGRRLGIGLAGVVNLLNPEMIVVGGGMANTGKYLFRPLKATLRARAMELPGRSVRIVRAKLGEEAGLIGAAELVRTTLQK